MVFEKKNTKYYMELGKSMGEKSLRGEKEDVDLLFKNEPRLERHYLYVGLASAISLKNQEAIQSCKKEIELCEKRISAENLRTEAYDRLKQYIKAEEDLGELIKRNRNNSDLHHYRSSILALKDYSRIACDDLFNEGLLYYKQQKLSNTLKCFLIIEDLYPNYIKIDEINTIVKKIRHNIKLSSIKIISKEHLSSISEKAKNELAVGEYIYNDLCGEEELFDYSPYILSYIKAIEMEFIDVKKDIKKWIDEKNYSEIIIKESKRNQHSKKYPKLLYLIVNHKPITLGNYEYALRDISEKYEVNNILNEYLDEIGNGKKLIRNILLFSSNRSKLVCNYRNNHFHASVLGKKKHDSFRQDLPKIFKYLSGLMRNIRIRNKGEYYG